MQSTIKIILIILVIMFIFAGIRIHVSTPTTQAESDLPFGVKTFEHEGNKCYIYKIGYAGGLSCIKQ